MQTKHYLDFECIPFANDSLSLLVTQSVGPRIISLRFNGGDNLFAELPDFVVERPDGEKYHFYGGHRLWHAPEDMPRTYVLDNHPVEIHQTEKSLLVTQQVEVQTGIEKSIRISRLEDKPQALVILHTLTNRGPSLVECAPWAITMLKTGGVAILPQSRQQTGFLANRSLVLWPYADVGNRHVSWGNHYILIHAEMQTGAFKLGFPNPRGWLAYWRDGLLFVKRAAFESRARYYDFDSSSACYCNDKFIELETMAPVTSLAQGASVTHLETWELYSDVEFPTDEAKMQSLVEKLKLE